MLSSMKYIPSSYEFGATVPSTPVGQEGSAGHPHLPQRPRLPRRVVLLLVLGVALAAFNLRTAVSSVGPVLSEITAGLELSPTGAGLLTMLPVLCFAAVGACAPALIRAVGLHRALLAALAALTAGLGTRVLADAPWVFLALSALALAGGAVGNVLLPTLIKQHFPHRIGLMTTVYTTALALGTAVAAAATVPVLHATGGSWRIALGGYAVFGAVAALPWLLTLRHEPPRRDSGTAMGAWHVLRTGMGRQSALFFGTQSMIAYIMFGWFAHLLRDSGMSATAAGLVLSYLAALGVPLSLLLPSVMARYDDHRGFVVVFISCYAVGFTGLWIAPVAGAWVWATFIGVGMASFPLALTLFAVRTRTASGTASLSAASQSVGYLLAGAGPLLFGLLHELSGGWRVPIAMLFAIAAVNLGTGLLLGRPRQLEDEPGLRLNRPAAT